MKGDQYFPRSILCSPTIQTELELPLLQLAALNDKLVSL